MSLLIRRAGARGVTRRPGLEARHTFSGGDAFDPAWTGVGALRALNVLALAPGADAGPQRRANMDVLTWVLEGAITTGDADPAPLAAGSIERLQAGHGSAVHEANAAADLPARLLQVWLQPDRVNLPPARVRATVPTQPGAHRLAARADAPLTLHGDAEVWLLRVPADAALRHELGSTRAWLHVVAGVVALGPGPEELVAGDGALVAEVGMLELRALAPLELLLVALP
ncbi:pirin family protein [Coralloluteibacterium stylophorae]|uniref:Pirin family protein n=1 Tax=Coralloluteibacterium stylophorae TaxID=1776034 RepID=A0A8J7VSU3_9GAMM|nr:pirin family protein [Coralloluteibacterium stylophorae]MBS7458495.1 pirin family protein [Coralloluteibacterium stylophorae]